jgi:hypothetical protein
MSYDFDDVKDHSPPVVSDYVPLFNDLEYITMILQLAAIWLTPEPDTVFTVDELLAQAHDLEGEQSFFDDTAAKIVLSSSQYFLEKLPNNQYRLK